MIVNNYDNKLVLMTINNYDNNKQIISKVIVTIVMTLRS